MALIDQDGPLPERRPDLGPCWLWKGYVDRHGYGRFRLNGSMHMPYRVTYSMFVGPIPEGYEVDHLCVVPGCVRPSHLEAVTSAENNRRSASASSVNSTKTSCHRGHEFTEENTYMAPSGARTCRACNAAAARAYQQRKLARVGSGEGES